MNAISAVPHFNSNFRGSVADFGTSVKDLYGYTFIGPGNGKGQRVKNNAASVWNRSTNRMVTVYFNSGYHGDSQRFAAGRKDNLKPALKNQNASHQFGPVLNP